MQILKINSDSFYPLTNKQLVREHTSGHGTGEQPTVQIHLNQPPPRHAAMNKSGYNSHEVHTIFLTKALI